MKELHGLSLQNRVHQFRPVNCITTCLPCISQTGDEKNKLRSFTESVLKTYINQINIVCVKIDVWHAHQYDLIHCLIAVKTVVAPRSRTCAMPKAINTIIINFFLNDFLNKI